MLFGTSNLSFFSQCPSRFTLMKLGLAALVSSLATSAHAQSADSAEPAASASAAEDDVKTKNVPDEKKATAEEGTIATVVVTANRRREPSREVPMQVNSVSTQHLEQAGAKTLSDYMAEQPGVDVKTSGGAGLGSISIRGVSTGNQTIATVGTYIDDAAVGSTSAFANGAISALDMSLLDLNHIELLRGPQGTLYGAGAMGGVLKYVTNEPDTYELAGQASLGVSFTRGGKISDTESGVINVPLKQDVAGLRISAFTDRDGGWLDAVGLDPGKNVNGGRTSGARVSLLIEPDRHLKIRLTDTNQALQRDGTDSVDYDPASGRPVEGHGVRERFQSEPYLLRLNVAAADIEYDFGWARLNSITSVQALRNDSTVDMSAGYLPLLQGAGLDVQSTGFRDTVEIKKDTQEFRLTSKGGGTFEWLGGLYWNRERSSNDNLLGTTLTGGGTGPDVITGALPATFREVAAYGDLTWTPIKAFSLTGGLRVARNQQHFAEQGVSLISGAIDTDSSSAETAKTYLLTAKYGLTTTSNVYFRAASGYRPGGPNLRVSPTDPSSFQHDSLWSYEGGYKAELLDRTLSIESSVYDIRWKNIQQNASNQGLNVIVNSGDAEIKGAEFNATYHASKRFTVTGSVSLVDAKLTKPTANLGVDGSRLPGSARVSGAVGGRYAFDLAGRAAYLGLSERFTGSRKAGFDGSESLPNYRLPSYALTDLQAGLDFKTFHVALFARNLFDRAAQLSGDTTMVPLGGPVLVTEERPRTVGFTLTADF